MNIFQNIIYQTSWKIKAIKRRLEAKILAKRIKELTRSRDTWKNKATERSNQIEELKKLNKELENELKKN